MACCGGPKAADAGKKERTMEIEKRNKEVNKTREATNRLLLLGPGESGKSTVFKQVNKLYGAGFPEEERKRYDHIVYNNLYLAFKTLMQQAKKLSAKDPSLEIKIDGELEEAFEAMEKIDYHAKLDKVIAAHCRVIWNHEAIKKVWELRSSYQLPYAVDFFMTRLDAIEEPDYIPTEEDVIRARVRTTGIVEMEFVFDDNKFVILDVGGQRNERKKWMHCFSSVTAVIFVVAISEYDQKLVEDLTTNRIQEALALFDEICNAKYFAGTSLILFLNKFDLFDEKIKKGVPITDCFPDFGGSMETESVGNFFKEKFLALNKTPSKQIYPHFTCATDTQSVKVVFQRVRDIVVNKGLGQAGELLA